MFTIFKKKKITEDQLAIHFVSSILELIDEGFPDVVEAINLDPEFERMPEIQESDSDQFILIIAAGNLQMIPQYFTSYQDVRLIDKILKRLAQALAVDQSRLKEVISKYQSWMSKINHPSKNLHYAMSKAIFHKYELNQYQTEYFRNMKAPNPIFLKRLDDIVEPFIWNWQTYLEEFRISKD